MRARIRSALLVFVVFAQTGWSAAQVPEAISLGDAVARALRTHPQMNRARAAVDEARARAGEARSVLLPRVDYAESITRGNQPVYAFGTRLTQERFRNEDLALQALNHPAAISDFQSRISAEVPLVHVAGWMGARAARHHIDVAQSQTRSAESRIVLETLGSYFGAELAERALQVADQVVETARADAARVRALHEAGMATDVDAMALDVAAASAEERALAARNEAALARATLNHVLDLALDTELTLTTPLEAAQTRRSSRSRAEVQSREAVETHPFVRAAASQAEASRIARRSAALRWLPVVALYGDLQSHRSEFAGSGGGSWTVGVVLRLNLFRGLGDWNHARAAEAVSRRVDAELEEAEDAVRLEIERARLSLETATARVGITRRTSGLATEALARERSRLDQGVGNVTALMHSRTTRLEAELNHLSAQYAQRMASARLAAALGLLDREWEGTR